MEKLVSLQHSTSKLIQKLSTNFRKDPQTRKTKEYVEIRLQSLQSAWADFEKQHSELEQFKDEHSDHKYYKENYFAKVETIFEQTQELMEDALRKAIERQQATERIEGKNITVATVTTDSENILETLLQNYSSLSKLQRVIAYCTRFITNSKAQKVLRITTPLTIKEIDAALILLIKVTQKSHFKEDITKLLKREDLHKHSRILGLAPFIDSDGILRVGGRLENAELAYDRKHPIILPYKSELTDLIINKAHKEALHGGNSLTHQLVRQRFWILNGLKAVKGLIHKCVVCHRYKAQISQQMMGMLPKARVITSSPFTHSGVDYAGPFDLLLDRGRGQKTRKGYIAIFICLTTKAIHIEVITELTSAAFIAAFRRFVSRRGPVAHLYSDNATNFVGASKVLTDLHRQKSYTTEINQGLQDAGTQWHFIPPASPHFGGLWEAGVKSIKHHMRRVIGETRLTYEEMHTLMTQIEACLNSRPLCPLSEDPESLDVLTPGHFLTGSPLLTVPDRNHLDVKQNLLTRWDRIQRMHQEFWKKWSIEYIGRLQYRPKWTKEVPSITKGNLVLIKDEQLPPSRWALGRVIETHPGADGLTRVVTLQTKGGKIRRPITKLSLLPVSDNKKEANVDIDGTKSPTEQECAHDSMTLNTQSIVNRDKQTKTGRTRKRSRQETLTEQHDNQPKRKGSTSTSATARSISTNNITYFLLLALFFLIVGGEDISPPYNITKFNNQEGIYFDDMAQLNVYTSEWNLLVYYDLSTYWKEFTGLKKSVRRISELCDDVIKEEICSPTVVQLNHQIRESEHINEVLYQQNERTRTRGERAPLDIVGTISNRLFGILDQDYAKNLEEQIDGIKENESLLRELLRNQTSIAESTLNVLKKNHESIQHQFHTVERHFEAITNSINASQQRILNTQTFTAAAFLITLNIMSFQHIQRSVLSIITDTKHGRLNTLLLTPSQLTEQIKFIREHLPQNVRLPGEGGSTSLLEIYNTMHVRMRITVTKVLFDIRIPLLNMESYRLYKLIPIPVKHSNKFIFIQLSTTYLGVNLRRDRFSPMNEQYLRTCQATTNQQLTCHLRQPIFTTSSNQSRCEISLLSNHKQLSPYCRLRSTDPKKMFIKLITPSCWIFIMDEETHFDILCGEDVHPLTLNESGIIQLRPTCIINHPTMSVQADNKVSERLRTSFIPETNVISAHLNLTYKMMQQNSSQSSAQLVKEIDNLDLEELRGALKEQQQHINNLPTLNHHHLHHYFSMYTLVAIIIFILIFYKCRKQGVLKIRGITPKIKRPQPAPRRSQPTKEDSVSYDLSSLNFDGGECAQHI